jgi:tetratricopeptide (TPR) repeat protein
MPSLSALREFKASFNRIGGQKADLEAKNLPFNDLELPDSEPASLADAGSGEAVSTPGGGSEKPAPASGTESPVLADPLGGGDFDFSAFLDVPTDDLGPPPAGGTSAAEEPNSNTNISSSPPANKPADQGIDDFSIPSELLSNLADQLEATPPDFPDEPPRMAKAAPEPAAGEDVVDKGASEDSSTGLPDIGEDLGFGDIGFHLDPEAESPVRAKAGEDINSDDFSLDDFDLGLPDDLAGMADSGGAGIDLNDFDLNGLDDFNVPEDSAGAGPGAAAESDLDLSGLDDFNVPEDSAGAGPGAAAESDLDLSGLDDFSVPEDSAGTDSAAAENDLDLSGLDDFTVPEDSAGADSAAAENDLDLSGLDDFSVPEDSAGTDSAAEAESELDLSGLDDFSVPEDSAGTDSAPEAENELDLSGLDDFSVPEDSAGADSAAAENELDLSGLGDFTVPEDSAGTDSAAEAEIDLDLSGLDDFSVPDDSAGTDSAPEAENELDLSGLDDFTVPEDSAGTDSAAEAENELDLSGLDDFSVPEDSAGADSAEEAGDAIDLSGLDDAADAVTPADDSLDNFDLGDNTENEPDETVDTAAHGGAIDDEDFSLPGLDEMFDEPLEDKPIAASAGAKTKIRAKDRAAKVSEVVEEIVLNDDDLNSFQKTLSSYPLNLRIACEEIIVEQVISPAQMSNLIWSLVNGATAKEVALLAGKILGKYIVIPRGFQKSTGEALEMEQASFAYIFVHNFLPMLRLFAFIALVAASLFYLIYKFVYTPQKAESIYRKGYERIFAGEYQRANERFSEAFGIHRKKDWFYKYAEAFRDERQYIYAEQKYDELLRFYLRDKKGVLDYAALETYYLRNYAKADALLRQELLDYAPDDFEGLLAAGDNNLAWGEIDPSKYEDARYSYARLLDKYGWTDPVVERMMKYFIRTDNLKEVLPLKNWFESSPKRQLTAESLSELGGYLLDKQLEEVKGVPNEYVEHIGSVRDLLLKAALTDPSLPESHYHLARYYHNLGSAHEERVTLELAIRAFDRAREESIRRLNYRIDAHQRYADVLINSREFIPAEEQLVRGINLYEDAIARRNLARSPKYGRLYASLGDLEYFTKTRDMETALGYYHRSEQNGWAPPEMQYRMGSAYYQLENWKSALEYFFAASSNLPLNRRLLFALGNASLKRGDYFAAQGYYNRLLDILETQRSRLPVLLPNDRPEYLELAERLMMAQNNAGVANEALADQTGDRRYRTRAMALYVEASRAWDARTRDPRTMIRSGSKPLPFLNSRNSLYPEPGYEPQIFIRIDREVQESSIWEKLAPIANLDDIE